MGRLDFLRKGKRTKLVADKTYILTKQNAKTGGMEKVLDLAKNMTPDELYPSLTAGIYAVHIYSKGQTGFESGPMFEVAGEVGEKAEASVVRKSPLSAFKESLEEMKTMKEDLKETFVLFGDMFSEKKVTMEDAMGYFDTLKKHKESLDALFPGSTTKSNEIPVSGTIPAWMAYTPQVIEQTADALEKRLVRWGLVDGGGGASNMSVDDDPIHLPEKPKVIEKRKPVEEKEVEDKEILVELPEKPKPESIRIAEVPKVDIKEEPKEEVDNNGSKEEE